MDLGYWAWISGFWVMGQKGYWARQFGGLSGLGQGNRVRCWVVSRGWVGLRAQGFIWNIIRILEYTHKY